MMLCKEINKEKKKKRKKLKMLPTLHVYHILVDFAHLVYKVKYVAILYFRQSKTSAVIG